MNWQDGFGACCWEAPSKEKLEALFKKNKTPSASIVAVEEHLAESLA